MVKNKCKNCPMSADTCNMQHISVCLKDEQKACKESLIPKKSGFCCINNCDLGDCALSGKQYTSNFCNLEHYLLREQDEVCDGEIVIYNSQYYAVNALTLCIGRQTDTKEQYQVLSSLSDYFQNRHSGIFIDSVDMSKFNKLSDDIQIQFPKVITITKLWATTTVIKELSW